MNLTLFREVYSFREADQNATDKEVACGQRSEGNNSDKTHKASPTLYERTTSIEFF